MSREPKGTTETGYINKNDQRVICRTDQLGTDHGQFVYALRCGNCDHEYGANGSDIWQRKCPKCQEGEPGFRL